MPPITFDNNEQYFHKHHVTHGYNINPDKRELVAHISYPFNNL